MKVLSGAVALWLGAMSSAALADDAADVLGVMVSNCLTGLETGGDVASGLERAAPGMEAKLLDGKAAKVFRAANPKVVLVLHDSGDTCEVMGLGIAIPAFSDLLTAWLDVDANYIIDETANMTAEGPGGATIVRQMPEGDFMQAFIQTQPEGGFVGITVSRVDDSQMARDMLGL